MNYLILDSSFEELTGDFTDLDSGYDYMKRLNKGRDPYLQLAIL